jgi:hypothetical protein
MRRVLRTSADVILRVAVAAAVVALYLFVFSRGAIP